MNSRDLERKATELLRKHGCTWSGRKHAAVDGKQSTFERRRIKPNGMGGYSRPKKGRA